MSSLFSQVGVAHVGQDAARNIVSLRQSQDLFDDLSTDPAEWLLAQRVEDEVKPPPYRSPTPIIDRPFEDAEWFNAIIWPFRHWQASRYSDGSFGVWYGAESVETTVYETVYRWYRGLISDAGYEHTPVVAERKVYWVKCDAVLLDFRHVGTDFPELLHPTDYAYCQALGARIHREGHPGMLTQSVRRPEGENWVIMNPGVLSNPRHNCQLTYHLEGRKVVVEKTPGVAWMTLNTNSL
ncbi:MAG: RES family NAD+ phosphorylase [Burkholderiales bacterium]|jgi:hypothetical protein|nr:RES family NAD+ phosphorylase [Burkholderiales bacterium]MCA3176035.1 RES family NAD+ phosphorylase [Burkholderiales bacterium]